MDTAGQGIYSKIKHIREVGDAEGNGGNDKVGKAWMQKKKPKDKSLEKKARKSSNLQEAHQNDLK